MAATETWVLDGVTLTSGGNFDILELQADPPKARPDWITAADSEGAALMRVPQHENRTITMKLRIASQASMNAALDQVGVILDKLALASEAPDGLALVWTPANSTRSVTFDVLQGEISELPIGLTDDAWSWFKQRPIFTLELTCKPYWRAAEVLSSTASASAPIVTKEVAGVPGDVPALARLIVTDTATQNRRHIEWGVENQYYNSGAPSSLQINSGSLVTSGFGSSSVVGSGSVNANVVRSPTVWEIPAQVVCGLGNQTHIGTFRVKARTRMSLTTQRLRLAWRVGDGPLQRNAWATPAVAGSGSGDWGELDLGLITVPPVQTGTQRWTGQIETYTVDETTTGNIDIDYLILIPAGEGYGKSRGVFQYTAGVGTGRDHWTGITAGGGLNGRVAPLGGTWATSGAATDFTLAEGAIGGTWLTATSEFVQRFTTSDTGVGRQALLGTATPSDVEVGVDLVATLAAAALPEMGPIARWVDASNFLWAFVKWDITSNPTNPWSFQLWRWVAGTPTQLASIPNPTPGAQNWTSIRLVVYASGRARADLLLNGAITATIDVFNSALATGGALATGKSGIGDRNTAAAASTRAYDNFYVATPFAEAISLYSGRTAEFRYDDALRQDSAGTYYGRPPVYRGTRFLLPTGTSRVMAKARRWDVEMGYDSNPADATQIQVGYQARGLAVPR